MRSLKTFKTRNMASLRYSFDFVSTIGAPLATLPPPILTSFTSLELDAGLLTSFAFQNLLLTSFASLEPDADFFRLSI